MKIKGASMATSKKRSTTVGGPLLAAALFCERILEDEDGSMSVIRMTDSVTFFLSPDEPAPRKHAYLSAFVAFKSGSAKGKRKLRLIIQGPTGKKTVATEQEVTFKGDEGGVNVNLTLPFRTQTEGLFWMDVLLDDTYFTSVPLRVSFERAEATSQTK